MAVLKTNRCVCHGRKYQDYETFTIRTKLIKIGNNLKNKETLHFNKKNSKEKIIYRKIKISRKFLENIWSTSI